MNTFSWRNDVEKIREGIKDKKRIVIKIGSSSLQHKETGDLDYTKLDVLCRELCNIRNQGKDVILVSSGAIAVGKKAVGIKAQSHDGRHMGFKQACAAIGQARLMMTYQKIFAEYNQIAAQILMTKNTIVDDVNRENAYNTFSELLNLGVIPIVNENDTVSTYEILVGEDDVLIGDNDTLSAIVASLVHADLLILLSDIDGLYSDDPRINDKARFIEEVEELTDEYMNMGKSSTGSSVGTGGMNTKMNAAKIATSCGADMIIANSSDIRIIHRLMDGRNLGTLFKAHMDESFDVIDFIKNIHS
ncbi:MAG: glutamate 5-kinase [Lachnospiraceae bacterium]|nr:glutamate 5-kinase [Lachnospiraceae bacterium]